MLDEFHMWMIGGGLTFAIFTFGVWLKIATRTDKKIDGLRKCNDAAHKDIHDKMDGIVDSLRDKIEELWKDKKR
jgi:hypothetical protein